MILIELLHLFLFLEEIEALSRWILDDSAAFLYGTQKLTT